MSTSHRLRLLPCLLALALLSCLALASPSRGATISGISDNNVSDWSDPTWAVFDTTGVKYVRRMVPWDVMQRPTWLDWTRRWIAKAEQHGLEVMISFDHPWEAKVPPAQGVYQNAVLAFRKEFPQVGLYTAWNEPNLQATVPRVNGTPVNPYGEGGASVAADYWVLMNSVCHAQGLPTCTVVGGDFAETSDIGTYMDAYKARLASYGVSPSIWAMHPYTAAKTGNWARFNTFLGKTENKPIWITEVGGMVCDPNATPSLVGGSYGAAEASQATSAQNLQDLLNYYSNRIQRTYYYFLASGWGQQPGCPNPANGDYEWDSALLGAGEQPRPAFSIIFPGALKPPAVATTAASAVLPTQVTLNGTIDPRGFHTTYRFDYGLTTSYGSVTPNADGGFNSGGVARSAQIGGLLPGTTYHYRVVASNPAGNTYGADQTFKTAGTPAESDVNGDHMSDFVSLKEDGYVLTATGQASLNIGGTLATSFTGDFDSAQYDGAGYFPIDVEDVNGDGYDDLVAIHNSGTVCTYLGQPDGRFGTWIGSMTNTLTPAILHPGSGRYEPIGVADVNGDGRGDLIVDDTSGKAIQTYLGQASGGFSSSPVNSVPGADSATFDSAGDYFVDAADVNGDGFADLVSQNTNGYARTYLGNASGGFAASAVQSLGGGMPPSMATGTGYEPVGLGDVNGDGRADFVTTHGDGNVYTFLANPDGSFSNWTSAYGGAADSDLYDSSGIEFMGVLDINGDGYADLLAGHSDGYIRISPGSAGGYFGYPTLNWSGNFKTARHHGGGRQVATEKPIRRRNGCAPNGCGIDAESDVNGDHKSDLVTLHTNGNVYASLGTASGYLGANTTSFSGSVDSAQFDETGYYPVDVEDVNGDTRDDLVAVNSSGDLATALGKTSGDFAAWTFSLKGQITPAVLSASPGKYEPIAVADANGDGRGDFIAYNNADKTVYTFLGMASGEFSASKVASLAGVGDSANFDSAGDYFIDAADVNGDGRADLVAQNTNGYGRTYLGNASGGFSSSAVLSFEGLLPASMATGSGYEPVGLGDVNGDGRADLVAAHSNGSVYTFLGQANGSMVWGGASQSGFDSSLYDGSGTELMGVLDVNGDGFADMLTAQSDGYIRIYPGQANGYFGAPTLNFSGTFTSTRANHSNGFQPVVEKPLKRRSGCAANGCH